MKKDNIEKELMEEWFKDHKAQLEKLSDDVSILTWRKPDTGSYSIRYVFDYNKIYITSDLGSAIFKIYDKIDLTKAAEINIDFFHKKLTAIDEEKWSFNREKAINRLNEEIKEIEICKDQYLWLYKDKKIVDLPDEKAEKVYIYDDQIQMFNSMIDVANECSSRSNWVYYIYECYIDSLNDYDSDICEWIFDVGNDYPRSVMTYLIGLKIAYKQLNGMDLLEHKEE